MSQSTPSTPRAPVSVWDSLSADLVVADDCGGSVVFPADAEAFARFLAERRQQESRTPPQTQESES